MPISVIFANAGWRATNLLEKLEEEWQWPVLKEIDNPKLDIYEGADFALLNEFINSIRDEKQIRSAKKKFKGHDRERMLRFQIRRRVGLYQDIFDFNENDLRRCERAGRRLRKILERNREKIWKKVGIAGAVMGVVGAGVLTYSQYKKKESDKN